MTRSRKSDLIPGERLKSFSQHWKEFQASRGIRKLVQFGYKMKFDSMPKLTQPRAVYATSLPEEQMKVVRASVAEFVAKGAVRKLSKAEAKQKPGFYSKLFTVPKPNGTWRMIIDMRKLNSHIAKKKFKMQGLKDVRSSLKPNMYGCVIDISDAYYHVSIHRKSRKYTRFMLDGDVYEYLGLPMGLTCSPRIFTKISKAVADVLRKRGIIIIIYIDVSIKTSMFTCYLAVLLLGYFGPCSLLRCLCTTCKGCVGHAQASWFHHTAGKMHSYSIY